MINNYVNEDGDEIVVEENVLYSSGKDLSTFIVVADQSDMCLKKGFKGVYRLHIGQEYVHLLHHDSDISVVNWSVCLLKNFGYSHRNFFIETGSRSITGPGKFIFHTTEGERIHQRLSQEVKFINEQKKFKNKTENNNLTRAVSVMSEPPTAVDIIKSKSLVMSEPPTAVDIIKSKSLGMSEPPTAVDIIKSKSLGMSEPPTAVDIIKSKSLGMSEPPTAVDIIKSKSLGMSEPPTAVDIMKTKPPAPPIKPRSIHLRNSTHESYQLDNEEAQIVSNQSKKSTPAFGVPVLISLTSQTSNLKVTDSDTAELHTSSNKDSNGLDLIAGNHTDIDKKKLGLTRSISVESSKSQLSKESKKSQKELKKQQKKKEEEEKKERKRREEEKKKEQKRKEEEEKKIKKELKKNKQKSRKTPSESSQSKINCEYSEPDAFLSEYAEVNTDSLPGKLKTVDSHPNVERIYSEPWSSLSLIPMLSGEGGNEVEYAQPEKRPVGKMVSIEPRDIVHTENYSGVEIDSSEYTVPAILPPNWEQEDDPNANVYSHLSENNSVLPQQDSVYGISSASAICEVPNFEDENPYEDTNILT